MTRAPSTACDSCPCRRGGSVTLVARTITLVLLLAACPGTHGAPLAGTPDASVSTKDFPTKPVRIVEPFGVGGGPDLLARALAPELSKLWGQPVTVENHPGAGATAAPALVAKSPADGYTLLLNTSSQAYSSVLSKSLPYDPLNDFIPTASLTNQPYVLVAGKPAGVTTVAELIAAARAKPGQLSFASTAPSSKIPIISKRLTARVYKCSLSSARSAVGQKPADQVCCSDLSLADTHTRERNAHSSDYATPSAVNLALEVYCFGAEVRCDATTFHVFRRE